MGAENGPLGLVTRSESWGRARGNTGILSANGSLSRLQIRIQRGASEEAVPGPHSESRRRHWSGGRQRYVLLPRVPLSRAAGQGHRCGGERQERCVFTDSQKVGRERNEKHRLPNGRLEAATPGRGVLGAPVPLT